MTLVYKHLDWRLILAALALSIIGVLLIYSAQFDAATDQSLNFYIKQLLWLLISLVIFMAAINLPLRMLDYLAYFFYGLTLVLLILVLFIGQAKYGAARWFSFGPVNLTPSDTAKLALLITLSRFLAYTKLPPHSKRRLFISGLLTLVPVILIMRQPDLGTSLVFVALLLSLWFWSGLSPVYLLLIISPLFSLMAAFHWITWVIYLIILIIVLMMVRPGLLFSFYTVIINLAFGMVTPFVWNRLADYQKLRILTFLDPGRDPRGTGYQIIQSKIAVGSGGLFGKGYLGGSQSQLKFLPERHTDFIFSVLGEEFGLLGTLIVVAIFAFIFYRGIKIAARCRSRFASNLAWGALTILFFQFFVNVGMTLGLTPVTGLPLPFLSYGGTSLVMSWILVGLMVMADYYWTEY
nr:rod shape-determining protein RodA [candidate division Zixibacteria bacterium]